MEISDLIAIMHNGIIVQVGTPWDLYFAPKSKFVADFIGAANFLQGKILKHYDDTVELSTDIGIIKAQSSNDLNIEDEHALVAFRPECIELSPKKISSDETNVFPGVIKSRAFLGRFIRYWVVVGGVEILVDVPDPGKKGIIEGEVYLHIPKNMIRVVVDSD